MAKDDDTDVQASPREQPKAARKRTRKKRKQKKKPDAAGGAARRTGPLVYPKHSIMGCLRIPRAVLENNAGKECTDREAANFAGIGWGGPTSVDKFGDRVQASLNVRVPGRLSRRRSPGASSAPRLRATLLTPSAKPCSARHSFQTCIGTIAGKTLPEETSFLANTATDSFGIPAAKVSEFIGVFLEDLKAAELLEDQGGKQRVLDITHMPREAGGAPATDDHLKKVSKGVAVEATDTCFVMMPFANPIGGYYATIYDRDQEGWVDPVRADTDIFATGKIIDQIWSGLKTAKVLVAELTGRNPNVLYELGLAHALHKPVVLISSNEADVPFDVRHVRVIYYELTDPFWGKKLIAKVAENIVSAIKNPDEAIQFPRP